FYNAFYLLERLCQKPFLGRNCTCICVWHFGYSISRTWVSGLLSYKCRTFNYSVFRGHWKCNIKYPSGNCWYYVAGNIGLSYRYSIHTEQEKTKLKSFIPAGRRQKKKSRRAAGNHHAIIIYRGGFEQIKA